MKKFLEKISLLTIVFSMLGIPVISAMAATIDGYDNYSTIGGEDDPAPSPQPGPASQPEPVSQPAPSEASPKPSKKNYKKQTKYNEKTLEITDTVSENTEKIILTAIFKDGHSLDKDTLVFESADKEINLKDYKGDVSEYKTNYIEDERIRNTLSEMALNRELDAADAMQMYQDLSFSDQFYEKLLSDESFAGKFDNEFAEGYKAFLDETVSQNNASVDTRILFLKNHFEKIKSEKTTQNSLTETTLLYHSYKEDVLQNENGKDEKIQIMTLEYLNPSLETYKWVLKYQDDCTDEELIDFNYQIVEKETSVGFILENPPEPEPIPEPVVEVQPEPEPELEAVPTPELAPEPVPDSISINKFLRILIIVAGSYIMWAVVFGIGILIYKKKRG